MQDIKHWWQLYRMGFLQNQSGIIRRFLREQGSWEHHLQKVRTCILNEVDRINPKTITVFGSGWLLDIPLQELVEAGANVNLVDIAHPTRIKHKFRNNKNITFLDFDLTGGAVEAAWVFSKSKQVGSYAKFIQSIDNNLNLNKLQADLYLSINILSQLSVHIVEFLLSRNRISTEQAIEVSRLLQLSHINSLPKGKSLLITDIEEEQLDEEGKLLGVKPRVFVDTTRIESIDSWLWNFDSHNEFHADFNVRLNVLAFRI